MPYYFAYGSNMNPARMRSRGLQFDEALAGQLRGFALCFNKRAHDRPERSYANIRYQRDGVVEGVLYRLSHADEIRKMDPFEGHSHLLQPRAYACDHRARRDRGLGLCGQSGHA